MVCGCDAISVRVVRSLVDYKSKSKLSGDSDMFIVYCSLQKATEFAQFYSLTYFQFGFSTVGALKSSSSVLASGLCRTLYAYLCRSTYIYLYAAQSPNNWGPYLYLLDNSEVYKKAPGLDLRNDDTFKVSCSAEVDEGILPQPTIELCIKMMLRQVAILNLLTLHNC